ncbi:CDP-glycerol glycerophosphotransferase family protein [Desulfonauticus submarinus]
METILCVQRDRKLYCNYNNVTPGPKAKNWNEVLEYLKKYESERKRICKLFNAYNDANNSERVYEAIKEIIK